MPVARLAEPGTPPSPAAAQIVDLLAAKGARLAELEGAGGVDAARALDLCVEALEACAEIARDEGGGVAELIDEAADLMVLLQLEGSRGALSDAVALLCQVRREGEARLAA
jgi:NH3-dependent NAD+ synthetase